MSQTIPIVVNGWTLYTHPLFAQQYRLFFRYHLGSKIIVYAWINDEKNKRAYGSKTDAYKVFERMLNSGNPPKTWDELLKAAKSETLSR